MQIKTTSVAAAYTAVGFKNSFVKLDERFNEHSASRSTDWIK